MDRLKMALSYEHCSQRVNQQGGRRKPDGDGEFSRLFFFSGGHGTSKGKIHWQGNRAY